MGAIFISYRREDTEGHAGRLFEDMRAAFGADSVFMDVAGIEPGRDVRKVIDSKVGNCAVLLSVIGRHWLNVKNGNGERRIDDPSDFVRLETTSALQRDISVIPVLVHGAKMPTQEDLPAELKELAFRNAVELTHARWDSDVQVLIQALRKQMPQAAPAPAPTVAPVTTAAAAPAIGKADQPVPVARSRSPLLIGAVLTALLAGGGYYMYRAEAEQERAAAEALEQQQLAQKKADAEKAEAERQRLAATLATPAAPSDPASLQGFGTNGFKVRSVTFGEANGKALGYFNNSAAGRWIETGPSGSDVRFQFSESARDEWSVYLMDESRDMRLQLDLYTRKITFAVGNDAMRPLSNILMAQ